MTTSLFSGEIKIAVAANVSFAIEDLKKAFDALHPDIKVKVTLGSSGKLTAQIKNGAPYQLFMSADMRYPKVLYAEGIALTKPKVYAQGGLALLSTKKEDFIQGLGLLKEKRIVKIAVANPKTAPYGKAAAEAMRNAGVYAQVKQKFVYGESISQTVSYALMATDIGIIAKSSLFSPKMARFKKGIHWKEVDTSLYTPIKQGMVILKEGKDDRDVQLFYDFISSAKAKKVFENFGYSIP